jgi:DNA modification methylase
MHSMQAQAAGSAVSTTFTPNQRLAVHRWFRYSAGFSATWAEEAIRRHCPAEGVVLDPFAGSGTTLLAAETAGRRAIGVEAHPFVARVARAKLAWRTPPAAFETMAAKVLAAARDGSAAREDGAPELLARIFDRDVLAQLFRLRAEAREAGVRDAAGEVGASGAAGAADLVWLALVSILRSCSRVGTAPWQYVLPERRKRRVAKPFAAFEAQVAVMLDDMGSFAGNAGGRGAELRLGDARRLSDLADGSIDLVVTSPPYPNNFDYADATRIELTFLGEVAGWGDLHDAVRRRLVRSCSQHTSADRTDAAALVRDPSLAPIAGELAAACAALADLRATRAGRKTYDSMIAAYFLDMAAVLGELARVVRPGGRVCLVIGDSAPYGVHVPVDRWLARLAEHIGFEAAAFEQTRARNTRWKNRKHRVPLREGQLWLERRSD